MGEVKQSIYGRDKLNEIVEGFICQLENGTAPWLRPYGGTESMAIPENGYTHRPYRGINTLVLWDVMQRKGYESNQFMSYKQAAALKGNVRKGEKGVSVIYWEMKENPNHEPDAETGEIKHYWFTRIYTVFNIAQIEGLKVSQQSEEPLSQELNYKHADEFVRRTNIKIITRKGSVPCYNTGSDIITMPPLSEFNSQEEYIQTAFHELAHASGAPHRLDRLQKCKFGDHVYAFEELTADLTAAFLGAHFQVEIHKVQHAEYLNHWINALREKPQILWSAAAKSQSAYDYLLRLGGEQVAFDLPLAANE